MNRLLFRPILLISFLLLIAYAPGSVNAQNVIDSNVGITDPLPGNPIQGLVQIAGFIDIEEWEYFNLEFAFTHQNVWFPISMRQIEIGGNILGEWDTSSITDGNYDLRLTVFLSDETSLEIISEGIRVRNYSVIETNTPAPTIENAQQMQTPTPENSPTPDIEITTTPLQLNPNPVEFSTPNLQNALIKGSIFGIILFAFLLLFFLRKQKN